MGFENRVRGAIGALLAIFAATDALAADQEWQVAGLRRPAEIRVDTWGIAHIYAASERDALFLQGYNVARDRLWQVDLWRKRGLGLLSRDFGPDYVAADRAARLFLYRGDMAAEWAAYGPKAKTYAEAFTAGLNAYVQEIRDGRRPLPVEFRIAGTTPDTWTADEVVRIRSHGLTRNLANEVGRARIACAAGLEATRLYRLLEPDWKTEIPDGLDVCDIPAGVLKDYQLATAGVRFAAPTHKVAEAASEMPADAIGSNNWTISGARTATGRPILANDPHREHGAPSLRYIVHLDAPGFSVIGAGEPALPGVSIGHNDTIAFGLTIFAADQEDLYVYETDPKNPNRYRYGRGWEAIKTVREVLEVKGGTPVPVELRFTRHGPILLEDPTRRRAYAVRSVWGAPGTSAYFGSVGYMTAKDWPGFKAAMKGWGAPSENQVYADASGHIGWIAGGKVPVRPGWDGLLPVPGDGRYEWKGFLTADELPSALDPAKGWFASANEMNLPADYPYAQRKVGFEWSNPARISRISEVLAANAKVTLADAMALQTDPTNVIARRVVPMAAALSTNEPDLTAAIALLRAWDGRTSADSAGAALFEVWLVKHLGRVTVAAVAPAAAQSLIGDGDLAAVVAYLESPDGSAIRDAVVAESLTRAFREVRDRLGADTRTWAWGRLHQAEFRHALAPLADESTRARMTAGPSPMGGTSNSPMAATWRADDYRVTAGASFRMVLDVGDWDRSMTINTPGQSGDPASPHFADLFPKWAAGEYVPLLYSRKAVEAATETVIRLKPRSP